MIKSTIILISAFTVMLFSHNVTAEALKECQSDQCVEYFEQYKVGVKRGHSKAMLTLAQFYYYGYGTPKDEEAALRYFKKAAKAGYVSAQFMAGYIYMSNEKLKDIDDSIYYLERASTNNYKAANFLLGMIYFDKKYEEQDLEEADEYFAQAYNDKFEKMPKTVEYIQAQMKLDTETFPKLSAAIAKNPLVKSEDGSFDWPKTNIEIITITSPPLEAEFERDLISFRKPIKAAGTRLKGKSCTELMTCTTKADIHGSPEFDILFLSGFSGAANSSN